jgi:hypothetical protein
MRMIMNSMKKLVLPTTLSDQGDSEQENVDFEQTTHPFAIKQEKENQNMQKEGERDWTR